MGILITPAKRFIDTGERILEEALDLLAQPTAVVEAESISTNELVSDDLLPLFEDIDTAVADSFNKSGTEVVAGGTAVILDEMETAPADATVDSVVVVDQRFDYIYMTGYVFAGFVFFVAHNVTSTSENVLDGTVIRYSVHTGVPQTQATSPVVPLVVEPGFRWLDNNGEPLGLPVTEGNLNATGTPTISIPDGVITETQLHSGSMIELAAQYTGRRAILTVSGDKTVSFGAKTLLGTVTFSPATTGTTVRIGQDGPRPLLSGYVSSTNGTTIVSIYGWCFAPLGGGSDHVLDGTQLKVLVY